MARDVRLEGAAFNNLVVILAKALPSSWQIEMMVTKLNAVGKVVLTGDADAQWTSLLNYAGEHSDVLTQLIDLIDHHLKPTTYYRQFLSWRGEGSHAKLDPAVSEVRNFRDTLYDEPDPRNTQHITTVRLAILEIKQMIEAVPRKVASGPNSLAGTTEEVAAARGKILDACGDTLKAVDQLIIDIAEAEQQAVSIQREYGVLEASFVRRTSVPHLLEDRRRVDRRSEVLLQVINEQVAHLEVAVLGSSDQGQAAPQPRAEP